MKLLALPLGLLLALVPANGLRAQVNVVPADDGTGTTVTPTGDRLDIGGGTPSRDGANLFHSFSQFDLNADQIANFLANPALRNILGRVVGGDASVINGLIQVTGGSPNLYLLNPAGVIFGPGARLNVPGGFTVSTATRVGFGNDGFFDVFGNSQYADLVGEPQTFTFVAGESGAILNAGELAVGENQNLLLLGSTVVNTGRLQTAGGEVIVEAVAGTQNVRLSMPGQILSLELPAEAIASGVRAEELPALLAGGDLPPTGLSVAADGAVTLSATGDTVPTSPGSTVVGGSIDATGPVGGRVQILGDRVGLFQAQVSASGLVGDGGTVLVGGDFQGNGPTPIATATYVSPGSAIAVDGGPTGNGGLGVVFSETATVFAGEASARGGDLAGDGGTVEVSSQGDLGVTGRFDLSAPSGEAGSILFDPETITIVSIEADTANDDLELADGAILFDDVIVDPQGGADDVDFVITDAAILNALDDSGTVVLQATVSIDFETDLAAVEPPTGGLGTSLSLEAPDINLNGASLNLIETDIIITASTGSISVGSEATANIFTSGGADIVLTAGDEIVSDGAGFLSVATAGGDIAIAADGNITNVDANTATEVGDSGNVTLSAGGVIDSVSVDTSAFDATGNAGNVEIGASGDINIPTGIAAASFGDGNGGQVQVESTVGEVVLGSSDSEAATAVDTSSFAGNAGSVEILADGDITVTGDAGGTTIDAGSDSGNGGAVTLTSENGAIAVSATIGTGSDSGNGGDVAIDSATGLSVPLISTSAGGNAGNVGVTVGEGIVLGSGEEAIQIDTSSTGGNAGNIAIAAGGDITSTEDIDTSSTSGDGGDITLATTNGDIVAPSIDTASATGNAGNAGIEATGDIQISGSIDASNSGAGNGGQVTIESAGGSITIGADDDGGLSGIDVSSAAGTAGTVVLNADSGVAVGDITATAPGIATTGVLAEEGDQIVVTIQAGELAIGAIATNGGNVNFQNVTDNITIDSINTAGTSDNPGGNALVEAGGSITVTNGIDTSSSGNGDGGTATLTSQTGPIAVGTSISTGSTGAGNGGDVAIDSATTLSVPLIDTAAGGNAGNVGVTVGEGIALGSDADAIQIDTSSTTGDAGDIAISAGGDITSTEDIDTASTGGDGGDITLATTDGNITTGSITSSSSVGSAGNVDIDATGNVQVSDNIDASSPGEGNGGQVAIASTGGDVSIGTDAEDGSINTAAANGAGGAVDLDSTGSLEVADINTSSTEGAAGTVALDAGNGIDAGNITATGSGIEEEGDRVTATTQAGELTVGAIATSGGNVTLQNEAGTLTADSVSTTGVGDDSGGDVLLDASEGITVTNGIDTSSPGNGGTATLTSQNGPIAVGAPIATGSAGDGNGGGIALNSGAALNTDDLITSAGTAGDISVTAAGDVVTGAIVAIGTGTGGQVNVESTGGNVSIGADAENSSINTAAVNGNGGAVDLDSAGSLGIAGNINTSSSGSAAGDVAVDATGDITAAGIFALADSTENGGNVSVTRTNANPGNIALSGPIVTLSVDGNGGAIAVTNTAGDVEIGALSSRSINGVGGNIVIDASEG